MSEDRAGRKAHAEREAAKHVESFGVDLWIRVQFPAPPPLSEPPAVAGGPKLPMWNDTDIPLAHLITFRCYGTWLHGDDRGSVDRDHNRYKEPFAVANRNRDGHNRALLKSEPVKLDAPRRRSVEKVIRDTCMHRRWVLHAVNVRTNHAHVVVCIGNKNPTVALGAFKANATRQMREDGCWPFSHSPWADKGSCRYLWNERSVERAIDYVINGQGDDLPEFD